MINGMDKLAEYCEAFYTLSEAEGLEKEAAEEKGSFCVPASASKDGQPHFPIDTLGRGRNALARVHQYSSAPPWYKGSLKGLQDLVARKVHSKYPSIGKEKKSALEEVANSLFHKNAQQAPAVQPAPSAKPAAIPAVPAKPAAPAVAPTKLVAPVAKPAPAKPAAPKGKLTDQQYQEMIKNITQNLTPQQQQNLKQIETQGTARHNKVAQQAPAEKVHPNKVETSDAFNDLLPQPTNSIPAQQGTTAPAPLKGQGVGKFDHKPQSTALPPAPGTQDPKSHGKFRSSKFARLAETLVAKNAQMAAAPQNPQAQMQALQAKMDAALQPFGYVVAPGSEVMVSPEAKTVDVSIKAIPNQAKFPQGSQTGEIRKLLAPLVPGMTITPTVLF